VTPLEWLKVIWSPVGPADTTVCAVLTVLSLHMDRETGECWPGVPRVARHAKVSERTVQRCLRAAALDGWLRVVPPKDYRDTNHYFPAQPSGVPLFDPADPVTPVSPGDAHVTRGGGVGVTTPVSRVSPKQVKEQVREHLKEGEPAFLCPVCASPMKKETPRDKSIARFWGCTRYRSAKCPGKRELDGTDSTPKAALEKAKAERAAGVTTAFLDRERAHREKVKAERAMQPVTDAVGMAKLALSKKPPTSQTSPHQRATTAMRDERTA
jgi:hypothetical protein